MQARTILQFLAVVLFWGTSWIAIKHELGVTSPAWSVTFRFTLAGLALLGWCRLRGLPLAIPGSAWPFLLAVGFFQFVLNFNFVYAAEQYVPSAIPAVAFAVLMVPNALLARIFLKKRMTKRFLFGSVLGIVGVLLLFAQQIEVGANRSATLFGLLLVGAAVLSSSIVNVMQASARATSFPPLAGLAWSMLAGAAMDAVFSLLSSGPPQLDPSPAYWIALAHLALLAGAVTFAIYFDLIRRIGPAEAAWTSVVIPILAMIISTLFEDFQWTAPGILGCLLALFGLATALTRPRPAGSGPPAAAPSG